MILIFSAPSGSGKSTLVNYLLSIRTDLEFSISATTRAPRGKEVNGKEYYFITPEKFRELIHKDQLVEYEEVYEDRFYGTLKSEIERIQRKGHHVVFDVDVKGGANLKKKFGKDALAIFVAPPTVEELRRRLVLRGTDSAEMIEERVGKAALELEDKDKFDIIIVNDNLDKAKRELEDAVKKFIEKANERC